MALAVSDTTVDLLDKVKELAPLIRKHAPEAERERRLSEPVAKALRDAGFFRMFRPRSRGGLEYDPVSAYRVIEGLAYIDSAAGWNVSLANACEAFGGWFSDPVSEHVYGSPDTVMAGAFFPPRKAVPIDDGYLVSGRTSFNSNCHAATWLVGLANIYDGDEIRTADDGQPITLLTVVPAAEAQIVDNWNTMGMCGTGSHDVVLDEVFVPKERAPLFAPPERPSSAYDGPSHTLAVWGAIPCNAVPALGIAQAAIDKLVEAGMKVPAYTERSLRDRNSVQFQLARAAGKVDAARAFLHAVYNEMWQHALDGGKLDMSQRARCQLAASHVVIASAEAVDLVHACVGASGIRNEQGFQRHFRDVHVITQHAYVCASRLESVGQIMLGLEPDWPFFQF